ncbi:MAG: hypothetical protein ACHP7N_02825 [Caulobacterales bacterium]
MTSAGASAAIRIGLGFRALRGGAVVVGVALEAAAPRAMLSTFLATAAEGDRLSLEPYHVAYEMERGPGGAPSLEAAAAVAEGRRRQDQLAANSLAEVIRKARDVGYDPVVAALLINRAGWMTDLLAHSLSAPEHPPVTEGLAVREALRFAFGRVGLDAAELDEKSLPERASAQLRLSSADLDARLKAFGADVGPPWRKEQKLACLAAWVALATAPK